MDFYNGFKLGPVNFVLVNCVTHGLLGREFDRESGEKSKQWTSGAPSGHDVRSLSPCLFCTGERNSSSVRWSPFFCVSVIKTYDTLYFGQDYLLAESVMVSCLQ